MARLRERERRCDVALASAPRDARRRDRAGRASRIVSAAPDRRRFGCRQATRLRPATPMQHEASSDLQQHAQFEARIQISQPRQIRRAGKSCSGVTSNCSDVSIVASLRDNSSAGSSLRKFSPTLPAISAACAMSASSV